MIRHFARVVGLILLSGLYPAAGAAGDTPVTFNIEPQARDAAVRELGSQAGLQVLWPDGLPGAKTPVAGLHERLTVTEALARLLEGSAIRYTWVDLHVLTFQPPAADATASSPSDSEAVAAPARDTPAAGIPRILIKGSRSLDADIQRTPDDARPVLVIDRNHIARSAARTLPDLLRTELPAFDPPAVASGSNLLTGEADQIGLRGLPASQTLILLDGRRVAGPSLGADALQPDLSTIPLESIERVEVLPATASARYGFGASAGVINIVLNRDSPGTRVSVRAGQPANAAADLRQIWAEHIHAFGEDRGRVALSGMWSRQAAIELQDWNFLTRGRVKRAQNDPESVQSMPVPPLGRLTNVRTVDGSPILPGGSAPNLFIPPGYDRSQGLAPLEATEGRYSVDLPSTGQVQGGAHTSMRPGVEVRSGTATARWAFNSFLSADLDLAYGSTLRSAIASGADYVLLPGTLLRSSDPTNVFGKDVYVTVPFASGDALMWSEDRTGRAMAALGAQLPRDWLGRIEYTGSSSATTLSRPVLEGNNDPIGHGLDVLADPIREEDAGLHMSTLKTTPVRSVMESTLLSLAGSPFPLPAGAASLTLRAERRRDKVAQGSAFETLIASGEGAPRVQSVIPEQRATTDSTSAELHLPLIHGDSDADSHAFLEADLAVHADRVRIDAAAADPAAPAGGRSTSHFGAQSWMGALAFRPADSFLIRGSCGTGFQAPPMSELTPPATRTIDFPLFVDPASGEPVGPFDAITGGDPHLRAERSRSCTGGLVFEITGNRALRFSADYTHLSRRDVVFVPATLLFTDPTAFIAQFSDLIVRAPGDSGSPGRILQIEGAARNLSRQEIRAWDLALDSLVKTAGAGTFGFSLRATIQPVFALQMSPGAPVVNDAGIGPLAPPLWRLNSNVTYERGPWTLGWSTRYVPHYRISRDAAVIKSQGSSHVPGQDYHDLFGRYTLHARGRHTPVFHLQAGIRNVFRRTPPFDVTAGNYASRPGVPEIPSYELSIGADF